MFHFRGPVCMLCFKLIFLFIHGYAWATAGIFARWGSKVELIPFLSSLFFSFPSLSPCCFFPFYSLPSPPPVLSTLPFLLDESSPS